MRVLHVIGGISRTGGGPSRSSQGLVAALREAGIEAWLMTLNHGEEPWIKGVDKFVNGGSFAAALEQVKPDIVHLHGIWQINLHRCAVLCRQRKIPYVIAPRGMLEPWSLKTKWLKKRIARLLYQDYDLKKAVALHATAESEAEQFRKLGFGNPVIISPNGVNLPERQIEMKVRDEGKQRRALFVSRMHPKKGVLELVEAWRRAKPKDWQCELVYTLNGEGERAYEVQVKRRILDLGMFYQDKDGSVHPATSTSPCNFIFTGSLSDDKKWEAYARADLFVLPTYSENFGIVVAEALWAGVPVITTKGTPWSDLIAHRCGWWIDLPGGRGGNLGEGEQWNALDSALREATLTSAADLRSLGQDGRVLVETKYAWSAAAKAMVEGYERVMQVRGCLKEV